MLPLGVSMLWESTQPELALRERFGFADLATVAAWASTVLDRTWGINATGCTRLVLSDQNALVWVRSDRGGLVVKCSRAPARFAALETSTRLLLAVAERGLPVAAPIATVDGRGRIVLLGPAGPLSVTVLPELGGDWLDVRDEAAVRSSGACLAEVHRALRTSGHEVSALPTHVEGLEVRIDRWLADEDRGVAPAASRRLRDLLSAAPMLDDEPQPVHNDFRAANILTRGSEVVGLLDFDEVVVGHRVDDLAKACVYLGTRFTGWGPTPVAARRALRAGYEAVRPLSPAEARWFDILELWQGLQAVPDGDDPAGWASAL